MSRLNLGTALIWCNKVCANRLSLNVAKTEFIVFRPPRKSLPDRIVLTLNNTKIFESYKIKYLGLLMDTRLNWKAHIHELSKKLSQSIGMLYKIRKSCNQQVLLSLYHAIFNSHMTYGLPVWGNTTDNLLNRISTLLKKQYVLFLTQVLMIIPNQFLRI